MKRKLLVFLLAAMMALTAACQPSTPTGGSQAPAQATTAAATTAAATAAATQAQPDEPDAKEPITLTVWRRAHDSPILTDWSDNAIYPEIEKLTGVTVEWISPAASNATDHFNVTIASGVWPDIFYYPPDYPGGAAKGVEDEVYIDLTPLMEEHAPNYLRWMNENPQINKEARQDDGRVLSLMEMHLAHEAPWGGPWVRTDLLEQVGRDMPETVQDWYETLVAFKDIGVEYPWVANKSEHLSLRNWSFMVSAYGAANDFINNNGTVEYGWLRPQYKDFLTELAKWYAEGLYDPDFDTRESTDCRALFSGGKAGAMIASYGNAGVWLASLQDLDPNYTISAAPYPVMNKGDDPGTALHIRQENYMMDGNNTYITTSCENPGRALEWLDFNYTVEGFLLHNYGVEGVSWNWAPGEPDPANAAYFPPELLGLGKHPEFTELMTKNPDGYEFWEILYKYKVHNGPYLRSPNAYVIADISLQSMEIWSPPGSDWYMPNLAYSADEQRRQSELKTDIEAYRDGELIKFVKGQRPLDQFDAFVQELKNMGIDEWVALKQAALDRYNSR